MSSLRLLAFSYLAVASVLVLAWAMIARPVRLGPPSARLTIAPPYADAVWPAARLNQPEYAARSSVTILPDLSPEAAPVPPAPQVQHPQPPRADKIPLVTSRVVAATLRLKVSLTPEMLAHFDLFVFVSKAESGLLAQRMFVFRKVHGDLVLLYDWAVSTGRERSEISPRNRSSITATPAGFYQLDPARMYPRYQSWNWMQDMPWAMFFNWERHGVKTGLAIHAAVGDDIAKLGMRASAGCVHLSPDHAETLYRLIQRDYRGVAPRFAYNVSTQTMSNRGGFLHRRDGSLHMVPGYRVLIDIDE